MTSAPTVPIFCATPGFDVYLRYFMDREQRLTYEKDFRLAFLEAKGDAFQRLFEQLMGKLYPNDFLACRPWGLAGDRKNDGYLASARTLYQVYAPNALNATETVRKIHADFEGAKGHWMEFVDEWTFVHNAPDGRLPPQVIEALCRLRRDHSDIRISHMGFEELLLKFRRLPLDQLESWFGPSVTGDAHRDLGYDDLLAVLQHIEGCDWSTVSPVKEVSPGKLEANLLSRAVAEFLKIGMQKSHLVEEFFSSWRHPAYGERIAQAFHQRYLELMQQRPALHPDEVFGHIEAWAGGRANTSPRQKAAVLAVMAYLFDKCEIFEDAHRPEAA